MIARIFIATLSGLALGAVLMALGNRRVPPAVARERWKKLVVYFLIVHVALACAALGPISMFVFVVLVITLAASELRRASSPAVLGKAGRRFVIWLVFTMAAATTVVMVPMLSSECWLYLYLLIAVFDGFSQVVGQLIGRHRLAPRLSPGKTVEGAVGGLIATLLVGYFFRELVWPEPLAALLLALAVAVAGLAGDLAASWIKRQAGIKDFGAVLPGQGGILDRFDSFLAASAIVGPIMQFAGGA